MKYIKVAVPDAYTEASHPMYIQASDGEPQIDVIPWQPEYVPVLDYGFVGLVDFMGDDEAVTTAARVSYAKGTKRKSTDRGLIRYLMRNRHSTPFEMCEFKFHIKAPIFVFRQWHRHRTFSINEESARYSEMTNEMYIPEPNEIKPQAKDNKQGRAGELAADRIEAVMIAMEDAMVNAYNTYKYLAPRAEGEALTYPEAINNRRLFLQASAVNAVAKIREIHPEITIDEQFLDAKIQEWYEANDFACLDDDFEGVAREIARIVMPLATYSSMYWKGNLKNLFGFIQLRADPHAQYEIRVYADALFELIQRLVPDAAEAFVDYQLKAITLSRMEVEVVREILAQTDREIPARLLAEQKCTEREIADFYKNFIDHE